MREHVRASVASRLRECAPTTLHPTSFDIHVASSGLQKAIRRGDVETAIRCALRLHHDDPRRLWRRLSCIAFEDIGIADTDLVRDVALLAADSEWRQDYGDPRSLAVAITAQACRSPKDRTVDELLLVAECHPSLAENRRCADVATSELLSLLDAPEVELVGFAAMRLLRWSRYGVHLSLRRQDVEAFWSSSERFEADFISIGRAGLRVGASALAAIFPLIQSRARMHPPTPFKAHIASSPRIGDLPAYALDGYTRPGRLALRILREICPAWRSFLNRNVDARYRDQVSRDVLFRVEGGLIAQGVHWPDGDRVNSLSQNLVPMLSPRAAEEAIAIQLENGVALHEAREQARLVLDSNLG